MTVFFLDFYPAAFGWVPAHAPMITSFFPASTYNANTALMDAALGITGYTTITFETTTLLPGLTITLTGGSPA